MKLAIESNGTKLVTKLSGKKTSRQKYGYTPTDKEKTRNNNGEKGRKWERKEKSTRSQIANLVKR